MATFVTLEEAKLHLGESWAAGDAREADLQTKLDAAELALLRYLDDTELTTPWTPENIPTDVKAAILLQTGEFWRFRGDDVDGPPRDPDVSADLQPAIASLLRRWRHHAL